MQSIHSLILEFLDLGLMASLELCTKYECIYRKPLVKGL